MATKSTAKRSKVKPDRPEGFPLFAHNNGQWAKRIRGTLYCFGVWSDPEAARQKYLDEREYLEAGRKPPTRREGGLRLVDAVNRFLTVKHNDVQSGELTQRSWNDYDQTLRRVETVFGKNRLVDDLTTEDFEELKAALQKGRNLTTLGNEIQRARCFFGYLWQARMIPAPAEFGPTFKRPSKKARRRARNSRAPLAFTAEELRAMIDAAHPRLRCMILLACNTGMGNTDLAQLPISAIDLEAGAHSFGRPKTGVARYCPLWPETIKAIREVIATRPEPKAAENADLLFVTRHGRPYIRLQAKQAKKTDATADTTGDEEKAPESPTVWNDAISRETDKLLRALGFKRPGLSFYSIRRTFRTIAAGAGDERAADFLMGHADDDSDMGGIYIQNRPDDSRLLAVTDCVKAWLFPPKDESQEDSDEDGNEAGDDGEQPDVVRFTIAG